MAGILGCSRDDPLQSLDFALRFEGIGFGIQVMVAEGIVLNVIRVVEKQAGNVIL